MKICILTHTYPRFQGDTAAPFMDGVASGLEETGNEVFVLTPFHPVFKNNPTSKHKVITYKYIFPDALHKLGYSETLSDDKKLKIISYLLAPFMLFFGFWALLRLVQKKKIDLINAHWILPNGFIAALVLLITGTPVVSTLPGSDVYLAGKNKLFSLMATFAAWSSSAITSNSPQLLQDLKEIVAKDKEGQDKLQKKFHTIIYGVDPSRFKPDKSKNIALKRKLGIPKKDLVVVGVGRLVAKKGFKYLIEAAKQVLAESQNASFVIVGSGEQEDELRQLAHRLNVQAKFHFTGVINYESLVHYYNLGDIFVLPSIRDEEGNLDDQSVSVVEAMACRKPIVTTNFPGYSIVVEEGRNGFLTKEKDSNQLAEALLRLLSSNRLRSAMGRRSRELVLEKFSWDAIGRQYLALFTRVLQPDPYSSTVSGILKEEMRLVKAKQIMGVLKAYLGDTQKLSCLDVGCSSGVITNYLSKHFKKTVGIDIDSKAIAIAKRTYKGENLRFLVMGSGHMKFQARSFDVVVCNQAYEFVDDQQALASEIHKVLKPNGICFLGARNKLTLLEGQTGIPLLHFLPLWLAKKIASFLERGYYPPRYLSLWGLRRLFEEFEISDITSFILRDPRQYEFHSLKRFKLLARILPLNLVYPFLPNYIWLLKKN